MKRWLVTFEDGTAAWAHADNPVAAVVRVTKDAGRLVADVACVEVVAASLSAGAVPNWPLAAEVMEMLNAPTEREFS